MRERLCILLASILFAHSGLDGRTGVLIPSTSAQKEATAKPTFKERILEIPPGTLIEVRLLNKERIRGRLGEVTDEGFTLQTAKQNKIETRKISFDQLKSFTKVEDHKGARTAGYIVLGALAGVGVLFLILLAAITD